MRRRLIPAETFEQRIEEKGRIEEWKRKFEHAKFERWSMLDLHTLR